MSCNIGKALPSNLCDCVGLCGCNRCCGNDGNVNVVNMTGGSLG